MSLKSISLAIMITFVLGFSIRAQTLPSSTPQPPPPPPAATKKWEATDAGFKVGFPAQPTSTVRSFEGSFGPTNIYTFNLPTVFAHYTVTYFDFPTVITDKYDLDTRFDLMRDEQAKRLSARVMHDSELMFGSHYGRESVFETAKETVSMRTLVAGPRMFVLIVVTQGRQSAVSPSTAAMNKRRISGFFDSFEITKLPEAKAEQVKLPADFQIAATNTSFKSGFLGVSVTPPIGWVLSEQKDAESLMELGKEQVRRSNARLAEYLTNENSRVLAVYTKSELSKSVPDAFIFLLAEQAPYPTFTPIAIARTYEKLYLERTEKVTKPIATLQLGGREFAWLETFDSESKIYHRIYFANVKGIALMFSLVYSKPVDLQVLVKSVETISFSQQ